MLSDILHKVAAMDFEEQYEGKYKPRPSLSGPQRCIRQLTYWARGEEKKPLPGRAVVVMEDSSWHEELTADLVRRSAFKLHSEQMSVTIPNAYYWRTKGTWECVVCKRMGNAQTVYHNSECHGHIDFMVTDLTGKDTLVEHKALSHFGFQGLLDNPIKNLPLDYFTQTAIYMRGAQAVNPELKDALLLVKNKNQSGYLEFVLSYNGKKDELKIKEMIHHTGDRTKIDRTMRKVTEEAFAKFARVEAHRKAGTLPDRQYYYDNWHCEYCMFNRQCWLGYVAEFNEMSNDAVVLEGNLVELVKTERAFAADESKAKKGKEAKRKEIKRVLKEFQIREGVIDSRYRLKWTVKEVDKLNTDLLQPSERDRIMEKQLQERLDIKEIKQ